MFEVMKMADVSTGHISLNDNELLELAAQHDSQSPISDDDFPLRVVSTQYGFVVFCRDKDSLDEVLEGLSRNGMSKAFHTLYKLCMKEGIFAINFDRDASVYEELEKFDW